jgi:cytochrome c oxidase subunit 4
MSRAEGESRARHAGRPYVMAWFALLLLTAASYGVERLHFGRWGFATSLFIAALKASIVLIVFMHVRREPVVIRFLALLNVIYVLLICLGIAGDVAAR